MATTALPVGTKMRSADAAGVENRVIFPIVVRLRTSPVTASNASSWLLADAVAQTVDPVTIGGPGSPDGPRQATENFPPVSTARATSPSTQATYKRGGA